MNTSQYNSKVESLVAHCLELTLRGATFAEWTAYRAQFMSKTECVSDTRRAAQSSAMRNQTITMCYFDGVTYYAVKKPNNSSGGITCANGRELRTTNDLHDRVPHITQVEWESMERVHINLISGVVM